MAAVLDQDGKIFYMHTGMRRDGNALVFPNVFAKLDELFNGVNLFLGRVFRFLNQGLTAAPIDAFCGFSSEEAMRASWSSRTESISTAASARPAVGSTTSRSFAVYLRRLAAHTHVLRRRINRPAPSPPRQSGRHEALERQSQSCRPR